MRFIRQNLKSFHQKSDFYKHLYIFQNKSYCFLKYLLKISLKKVFKVKLKG